MSSILIWEGYRRRIPLYVRVCAIVVVLTVALSFVVPHTFTSTSSIMPPESKSQGGGLSSLLQGAPIAVGLGSAENKAALVFVEILKSRSCLLGIVDTLKLRENVLFAGLSNEEFEKQLRDAMVVEARKTGTVTIEVEVSTGWLPFWGKAAIAAKTAADIGNAARTMLDKINREKSVSQARRSRMYIERVLGSNRKLIDSLQNLMQEFQSTTKVMAPDEQLAAIVQNAVMIGTELSKAEIELTLIEQDFQPSSPQVTMLRKKVATLREQYNRVQAGGMEAGDEFSIPLNQLPQLTRTYTNLVRDIKIKEQINAYLESQRMQEAIQEAKDIPTVIELDAAVVPEKRTSPSRVLMVLIAWFLTTVLFAVYVPYADIHVAKQKHVPLA